MDQGDISVGSRVECNKARGSVKWVGHVPNTEGLWLGVDWDDESRGKHDGSHKGEKYFETRTPTSGSFVRPSKLSRRLTLEEAVRGRYQDDTTIETQYTDQLQRAINARFVEVVGMEKIGKRQSKLDDLENIALDGWNVYCAGPTDYMMLLPRLQELNLSHTLLSSWDSVVQITRQLPRLRFLNLSGNLLELPENPEALTGSLHHIDHLVLNNLLRYNWEDLLRCCIMFPTLKKLQVAYNQLSTLGPIPENVLSHLEDLDIGANPISSWDEICHVGSLPRLESLNANNCLFKTVDFPDASMNEKTKLFPSLKNLTLANNPLDAWDVVGNLNKLPVLETLVMTYDENKEIYFQEFAFARITPLMVFNRSRINRKEKKDSELFYLKSFNLEFYGSGGKEDLADCNLSLEFQRKHPNYLLLVKEYGAPIDESRFRNIKLKDKKITVNVKVVNEPEHSFSKTFLPNIKVSKMKMLIKRQLKINPATTLVLSYSSIINGHNFEVDIDNDMKEMEYYSIKTGDVLSVRW